MKLLTCTLGLALVVTLGSARLVADCLQYQYLGERPCHGQNCNSTYPIERCVFGCTSGICRSGYGVCCDTQWQSHNVAPDGGDCTIQCGGSPSAMVSPPTRKFERTSQPTSLDVQSLGHDWKISGVAEEALFIPDRCAHTYVLRASSVGRVGAGGQ